MDHDDKIKSFKSKKLSESKHDSSYSANQDQSHNSGVSISSGILTQKGSSKGEESENNNSFLILNNVLGNQNMDNIELLYKRYDFLDRNRFLDSIQRNKPIVLTGNEDPSLYLELPLKEQVKLAKMSFNH